MLPELENVIRLQEIDDRLADLAREITALPKHIAEIEKKLLGHERKLEADRAALSANQKERKRCEGDIQTQEQKLVGQVITHLLPKGLVLVSLAQHFVVN